MRDPREREATLGASNPGDADRHDRDDARTAAADAYADAVARGEWVDPATGWRVDRHRHDSPPSEPPPPRHLYPDDAAGQSARARDAHATGSPMVMKRVACTGCGTGGTYYGRTDELPDEHYCRRCRRRT